MKKNFKLNNYLIIFLIVLFSLGFFGAFYGMISMFFVDTSREVYIPMAMNNGGVLYKDIFNVYPPFAYQINAFLYKYFIFKESLHTLYWAGFINSLIIIFALLKIIRLFFKTRIQYFTGVLFVFWVMASCIYSVSLTNYILPYSYSMVYALSAFLWSLYFLLLYVKKEQSSHLIISSILFGLSLSFKLEFILYGIVLISVFVVKKSSLKTILISLVCFFIFPIISLLLLFKQGCGIQDILSAVYYMKMLASSKSVIILYKFLGFIPTKAALVPLLKNISIFFVFTCLFLLLLNLKLKGKKQSIFYFIFLCSLYFIGLVLSFYLFIEKMIESNAFYFTSIGVFACLVFLFIISSKYKNIKKYDELFIVLSLSSLFGSIKSIFSINFNSYGTYFFPLLFLVVLIFWIHYLPRYFKNISKIQMRSYVITIGFIIGCCCSLFYFSNLARARIVNSEQIYMKRGYIYVPQFTHKAIIETIDFIQNNTKEDSKILVLPEGAMINFLTNRKSDNKYYYLIPPNIEIFGEDNIVKDLEKDLPDYIILQSMSYNNFGETFFCESFGTNICSIIPKYYKRPIVFGKDFWIAVYKKKV